MPHSEQGPPGPLEAVLAFRRAFHERQYRRAWQLLHPHLRGRIDPRADPHSEVLTPFALVELASLSVDAPFLFDPEWECVLGSTDDEATTATVLLLCGAALPAMISAGAREIEITEVPFELRHENGRWVIERIGH